MSKHLSAALAALTIAVSGPALADQAKDPQAKHMAAPKDDHAFAMQMAQHHRDGIAMADAVIANGATDDVKAMARRIRSDQQKDLAALQAHATKSESTMPKDPDMERGMRQLKAAKGAEADRLFLELMIAHHASGLMMLHSAKPHLSDEKMRTMADDMSAKQAREIGELQRLRDANRSARR